MESNKHIIPVLIYDKLYTKKECQKILKSLGIRYYKLQVIVTMGLEVQELEVIPKDTNLHKDVKKAKQKGKRTHKFILQPEARL